MPVSEPLSGSRAEHMTLDQLLSRAGGAVQGHYRRTVARHGATGTAVSVLGVLAHADGLSQRELAGRVGLTPATLTPVLDALEHEGRIGRERDTSDRRIVRLTITDAGRAYVRSVSTEVAAALRARLPRPPAEHEPIIRDYLVAVLSAVGRDPGPGTGGHRPAGEPDGPGAGGGERPRTDGPAGAARALR